MSPISLHPGIISEGLPVMALGLFDVVDDPM